MKTVLEVIGHKLSRVILKIFPKTDIHCIMYHSGHTRYLQVGDRMKKSFIQ